MKRGHRLPAQHAAQRLGSICTLAGTLTLCVAPEVVALESSLSPYQAIIERNVFGLKPPPPPPSATDTNTASPPSKITLTGITTILGNKRALMKTAGSPGPAKPGEPPKGEQSYILAEGQRDGEIEVIEIDEKAGSVRVNNAGMAVTLTFEKDGAKLPATPAPAAPGAPAMQAGGIPAPTMPGPAPAGSFNPAGRTASPAFSPPTRPIRSQGSTSIGGGVAGSQYAAATYGGATTTPTVGTAAGTIPVTALTRTASIPAPFKSWPPEDYTINEDQQRALHLLQSEASKTGQTVEPPPFPQ